MRQLAAVFLRVGNTTFGGGDPTIAVLEREFDRRGWITVEQFTLAYGLARITPGTNVLAFCAATGWMMLGVAGAIVAVLVVTVPSAVLVVWLSKMFVLGSGNRWAHAAIGGAISAAVGAMFAAAFNLIRVQIDKGSRVLPVLIAGAAFALVRVFPVTPLQILGLAALLGLVWPQR